MGLEGARPAAGLSRLLMAETIALRTELPRRKRRKEAHGRARIAKAAESSVEVEWCEAAAPAHQPPRPREDRVRAPAPSRITHTGDGKSRFGRVQPRRSGEARIASVAERVAQQA